MYFPETFIFFSKSNFVTLHLIKKYSIKKIKFAHHYRFFFDVYCPLETVTFSLFYHRSSSSTVGHEVCDEVRK